MSVTNSVFAGPVEAMSDDDVYAQFNINLFGNTCFDQFFLLQ
jgi:hypothetical protein